MSTLLSESQNKKTIKLIFNAIGFYAYYLSETR